MFYIRFFTTTVVFAYLISDNKTKVGGEIVLSFL